MRPEQTLNDLTARTLQAIDRVLADHAPDWVLAQGDTTTAMAAALASFHRRVKLGHVEAGLRTGDLAEPFPEEANRRVIDLVASALFAPTDRAKQALLDEGVPPERIYLTGNTVVDALHAAAARLPPASPGGNEVLVTLHRRESFGGPLEEVLDALRELAEKHPTVRWIYPVHPNPAVDRPAHERLGTLPNVTLVAPLDHLSLVARLRACRFVITDSGGIQEEAPTFGKRVLVVRRVTERPEGVEAGFSLLVGTDRRRIVEEATRLLEEPESDQPIGANPYGDGSAGERIAAILTGESWESWTPPPADQSADPRWGVQGRSHLLSK
jgi:UDP-N-acetylglucosamine 2-epimerase (non-hydrolysing)